MWQALVAQTFSGMQNIINRLQDSVFLSAILNGSTTLNQNALSSVIVDLGTITTDQVVACAGASYVFIRLSSSTTQGRLLTMNNLAQGARVMVEANVTANILTLKMAGTDTASNTYTIKSWTTNSATGAVADMVATGLAINTLDYLFFGSTGFVGTNASPRLNFFSN